MFAADSISNTSENILWAQFVIVPLVLGFLTFLGIRTANRTKRTEQNSQDAANSVRPNGTGHPTQTAMIEDVLLHIGELRGGINNVVADIHEIKEDFSSLDAKITEHNASPGHKINLEIANEALNQAKETNILLNMIIENSEWVKGSGEADEAPPAP